MSDVVSSPEQSTTIKSQRVLACVLCQQRKIKCDRKLPCANCIRSGVQCTPVPITSRQRRRRFPERELLNRLRHYEGLLRQNNIAFESLHTSTPESQDPCKMSTSSNTLDTMAPSMRPNSGADRLSKRTTAINSRAMNLWHAMNQKRKTLGREDGDEYIDSDGDGEGMRDGEDTPEAVMKKVWDQYESESNDQFLFGSPGTNVDISTLHPKPDRIFRLWQIYLDNVNPLLKVTHTPSIQPLIIDAASDTTNINPTSEALLFSVYCVSILSLTNKECCDLFGSPRKGLLTNYQLGCQQALRNCGVLRSRDRDCLTALYLYLISVRPETDPPSLSSMLAVLVRLAQRMGIDNESTNARCTALEAEMRRRLWWSLSFFDNRICEISDYGAATLSPIWDCKTPLNVNDFEFRPEMKTPPTSHEEPTEAIFAVVRSELANFVRHSDFHLDFINPSLKIIANDTRHGPVSKDSELSATEKKIEESYLTSCNPENPLHCMTIWTTRVYLAKNHLLEYYWRHSTPSAPPTTTQRTDAIIHAMNMLEGDTKLMTSPLTKGFLWLVNLHFPFPAYIFILQDTRKRPAEDYTRRAWDVMSNNYKARAMDSRHDEKLLCTIFSRIVLRAWEAREAFFRQQDRPLDLPPIVSDMRKKVLEMAPSSNMEQPDSAVGISVDEVPMDFGKHGLSHSTEGQAAADLELWGYSSMFEQAAMNADTTQFDWATLDWNTM